jgi:hypothetical protein
MSITVIDTSVAALDPVDPRELFDAARAAAANQEGWALHDGPEWAGLAMYRTRGNPGAGPVVAVHFPAAGGLYPRERESGGPDCYARAVFGTGAFADDMDAIWRRHAGLVRELGGWLHARGIGWAWSFEEDPWIYGAVPSARGARS